MLASVESRAAQVPRGWTSIVTCDSVERLFNRRDDGLLLSPVHVLQVIVNVNVNVIVN